MIAGNLYTTQQNAGKQVKRRGGFGSFLLAMGMLLFSVSSVAQSYVQTTNTSGTTKYNGVDVTVTSSGTVSSASPCGAVTGPYVLNTSGAGSYTYTFSAPVGSVTISGGFLASGTAGQVHFTKNGSAYSITDGNLAGTVGTCGVGVLALAQGGDLTNAGNTGSTPNNIIIIPGPITTLTVANVADAGFGFGLTFTPSTYYQVVNTAGATVVNGVTTTVTPTGTAGSLSACGPVSSPYFYPASGDAYTYSFSPAVEGVNVPVVYGSGAATGATHFIVNGSGVSLTSANLNGLVPQTCTPATAVISGGDLTDPGNAGFNPSGNIMLPNSGTISTLNVSSLDAESFLSGLFITRGSTAALTFNNVSPQSMILCTNAAATSINSLLAVTDLNSGLTLTWTVVVPPLNGSIVTGGTSTSTGGSVTPTGFTYQPTASYSGTDGFTMQVSDGVNTVTTNVNIVVYPAPDVSNFSVSAANPCQGNGASVTISSTSLAAGTYNVTYNIVGANSATGVVGSVTMASNTGTFLTSSLTNSGVTSVIITAITNPCTSTVVSSGNVAGFTVNPTPSAIFVPGSVCEGGTMTVASGTAGGTYTSSNTSLATVVAGTGVVTGVGAGNPIITYTLGTGCFTTAVITVNPTPAGITGSNTVCTGYTSALADATAGGSWSSSNPAVGSISAGGVVTGITAGNPTITYTLPAGCFALFPMTVNATPAANTGTATVCTGLTTTLANGTGGGVWTSSNTGQATVGAGSGVVTGVASGNPTISYTVASGCFANTVVTVNTSPATIGGSSGVCIGFTTTLTNSSGGGTWTSSNTLLATVGSATGLVTGVAAGTPTITYTMPNGCFALQPMTVNTNPAAIAGTFTVCTGLTTTLTNGTGGGTWSSSNTGLATVGAGTGVVTGVAAGNPIISYTLSTGCFATEVITVNTSPAATTGSNTVCEAATTTLSNSTGGGTWTSSNAGVASVGGGTGVVTGVTVGNATITYTLANGCFVTTPMTVNPNPAAIAGTFTVCIGTTTTLTDATGGGTWSSSNTGLATVGAGTGVVTGIASGTPFISYTLGTGCFATQAVTVNPTPAAISGPNNVCVGANITLTDATGGGTWTSSSTGIATVGTGTGIVTGVSAGNATITYTLPTGCVATYAITVNPAPAGIVGSGTVCVGSNTTLTTTSVGGSWASSDITAATIGAGTGIVTGVGAGTVTMTYTLPTGCFTTHGMTVNPTPAAITGTMTVCVGETTTLSNGTGGGTWTSSNTALATIGGGSGIATGVASGVPTISYTLATGCFSTTPITVNPLPASIGGTPIVCVGLTTTLTNATSGGTWTSSNTAEATIGTATGILTGVSAGNPVITYTTAAGCTTTIIATINPLPAGITGTNNVCIGFTTALSNATPSGSWTSSNTSLATIDGSGVVTGVATGVPVMTYTLPTGCIATYPVTVNPNPPAITGTTEVCVGLTTPLFNATGGGLWTSSNTSFATAGAGSGVITGVAAGVPTITYTLPTGCFATTPLTVNPLPAGITGTTSVCVGLTTTLASATSGGSWSSSNTSQATVGAGTGIVTGIAAGTPTITYTLPTGCITTITVTVNDNPAAITGTGTVCTGFTTTLASATTGGSWSSSNIALATVNPGTGVVTGVAAGNPVITYTLSTGCIATTIVTVNQTPVAIAGTMEVCVGLTSTLTNATSGGSWSSSNTSQATVGAGTGVVMGIAAGIPIISYTMPTGCYVTTPFTVNPNPAAISGADNVCTGFTIGLANATTGGTWSSSDVTRATVDGGTGVVTGVAAGTPTITYTLSTGCLAVFPITVNTTPAAITGTMEVCTGFTTTLANGTPGGSWSSSNTSQATVGAGTGVVTGVAAGTPVISYTMSTGCYAVATVTVHQTPAAIAGTLSVCEGLTTALSNTSSGGTWSSSNTSLATVGALTGVVTGVAAGTLNISYIMPTGCYVIAPVTVNPTPAAITGTTVVCAGSNTTLSNGTSGGVWSSGNTSIATVGGGTGVVTGVAAGVAGITYTLGAGCYSNTLVTVNPVPNISNFTSTVATSPCIGGSSTVTISSTSLGSGTYTVTYNLSGANAATGATATLTMGSTNGVFTIPSGSLTTSGFTTVTVTMITNTLSCNSYPTTNNTSTFSVNALPTVYTVIGGGSYCAGGTGVHIFLSNSVGGVNYQLMLGSTPVGTPVAGTFSGIDFGAITTVGTYTVTATNATTGCTNAMAGSATVSIDPLPTTFTVTGGGSYCSGGSGVTVGLSGSQSAVNYQLYITGSPSGSPVAGTGAAITFGLQTTAGTYTVVATDAATTCTNNMTGSVTVSVNPLPAAITGTMFVCPGTTSTLSSATSGGTWTSSTPGVATIGSTTGVVTGVSAGTSIITYTLGTGCLITATVTVNPNPAAITGLNTVCVGSAITLASSTGGGTWTSSNTSLATVNITTGVVSGVAAGTPTITYTLSTGCFVAMQITVNPIPASIAGAGSVCVAQTTTLTNSVTGGTWASSNPGVGSIGSATGVVMGVAAGTVNITYTLPAGCFTTTSFTVNPIPATITGTLNACEAATSTLTNSVSGGSWTSSNTSLATVGVSSGIVSGISAGGVVITYTLPAGCFVTSPFTVNVTPAPITGTNNVCIGLTTALATTPTGGTWSSSNTGIATVNSSTGIVSGSTAGSVTISYTLTAGSCRAFYGVTVNPNPAAISGVASVCIGSTTTLSNGTAGGSWSSSNTSLATVGAGTGDVTGVGVGNPIITYSLSTGCIATRIATVNPLPASITGVATVCEGATTNLSNASGGGSWTSSDISLATVVSGTGVVTGVSAGTVTITYTLPTGCLTTTTVTVHPSPASIAGASYVCVGLTTTLTNATSGGVWSSSNSMLATVGSSTGLVSGIAVGTPFITYTLPAGCFTTMLISVNPTPAAITGTLTMCEGATTALSNASSGGTWASSNTAIATVGALSGIVTGVGAGSADITYTLPGGCTAVTTVTVYPSPASTAGSNNVCFGLTTTLTNAVSGGTWTSSNSGVAAIGSSTGLVSGVAVGSATITYTLPAGCFTTFGFTVNPLPSTITGTLQVCVAANTTLASSPSGGSWTSGNTSFATVGISSGIVTGVSAGTVSITYTLPTSCIITTMVTVNPLPAIYTMTGGGSYCAGASGVAVGLSNSQSGVNYQLYMGSTPMGSAVSGSGSAITFGLQTAAGTYTAIATNAITACQNNMTGTVTVTINPLPTVYNMTGGGNYCAGGTGVPVGLNGSQTGINYQLYLGGFPVGSPVAGTGSAISFGIITGGGTYTVVATNSVSTCTSNMAGAAVVIVNPLPTAYTVSGGGGFCVGGTGVTIVLSNSTSGVNYTVTNGSVSATLPGTGSALTFGPFTSLGTYTITGLNATSGCSNTMLGTAVISSNPLPTVYTITPTTGAYCAGSTGVNVGLSSSQTGVEYQLYLGTSSIGSPVAGGGGSISFGPQTGAGVYTAVATYTVSGCSNNMAGTATVSVNPLPIAQVITGGGGYCIGGTGVAIGLASSVTGTTYQLFRGVTPVGTQLGTGSAINFGLQTVAGIYTVVATIPATTCSTTMPGSAVITINPLPNLYSVTGGGSYCSGTTGLPVGLTSSDVGINYQLILNGSSTVGSPMAGTGGALAFGTFTAPGTYTVVATNPLTSCTSTMTSSAVIIVNPLPPLWSMTGGGSYCAGGTGLTVGLSGSTIGVNYQLFIGTTAVGIPMLGTGSALTFGTTFTAAGNYTVVATNISTTCTVPMTGVTVIAINPLPVANTVIGGGSYCAGDAGVMVGLDGSVSGNSYQLYNGTTLVGTAVAGTGAALDFGLHTTPGTYTVVATNTLTGCSSNMTGSVSVIVNALPAVYNVTGGGGYCAGGAGSVVGLSNSDLGIEYQLYNGTTPLGVPVAGTGAAISFGPQASVGSYTVVATNTATTCSSNMSGSVLIVINPLPAVYTVTGGGSYCPGGSGVVIGLSSSATGVNYQLYNGSSPVGAAVPGTGIDISFGMQSGLGTYSVVAIDATTTCTNNMTGSAVVSLYPVPVAYTVSGGGGYCVGGAGVNVLLSNSTVGVNYQLYVGSSAVGVPVAGTGSSIDFGPQTALGVYTVVATNTATTCTNNMSGSATVSLNPLPTAYTVTGGGGYCAGGTGVMVGLSNSDASISYQLMMGSTMIGSPLAGTGSAISFGMHSLAGTYTVVATNSITSCVNNMLGSATVMVNPLPIVYTVTGGGSYCAGGAGVHVGLNVTDLGVNYQLYNGTSAVGAPVAGTGADIDFGILTAAGTYTVTATNALTACTSNMAGSATITINPLPIVYTVTGGGSYCAGGAGLHVGLTGSNTGINYQLMNGTAMVGLVIPGTGASLDFGLQTTGGTYTVVATNASTGCMSNMTGSATITVNPLPNLDTVTGGGNYCPGGSGVHVGLSSSTTGVNYQLFRGTTSIGAPLAGTGSGLDFGSQTIVGTYFVVATNAVTGCVNNMIGSAAVNISALPTAYTVAAGSGSYCVGGAGVVVTLGGSALGVQYQLYRGTATVGAPVPGTGFPLSFGLHTSAGVYSVVATDGTTGCVNNMAGTPSITVNPLPNIYTVSGGGSYCVGGTGVAIMLSGSDVGVNYQLWNGSSPVGTPMPGTGYSLNFGLVTGAGTYTVRATNTATTCWSTMLSAATITVNPLPVVYFVIGGGSYCAGGPGVHVGLSGSNSGVNYQLFNGSVMVGAAMAGTNTPLDFGAQTLGGVYTVVATNTATGCVSTMTGSVVININSLPTLYTVTGGGNYCVGGTGVHVGLAASASSGVTYQLYRGVTPVGSPMTATGSALDFGLQTIAGTYTIVATNTATGCSDTMAGSAIVTVSPLPAVYTVTGGGSYCASTPGVNVGLSNSDLGVNYQLYNGTATVGGLLGGTGGALSFGLQPSGTYTVIAINATTGCASNMTGSATVTSIMTVTPSVSITTGVGDTVCEGTNVTFSALTVNGGSGPTFEWFVNGVSVGTGSSYTYIPTHGNIISVTMTSNATCVLPATASGSLIMTVKSNVTPTVSIAVSANDTVCQGSVVTFTPTYTWGGTSPVFSWFVNGVNVSTGSTFAYAPTNGDVVFSQLNSSYACVLATSALSNNIAMTVDDNTLPTVTIDQHPGANVGATVYTDTFTTVVTNGGMNPSYQWSLNGVAITGATSATYVAASLNNGDAVSVNVTKTNTCGTLMGSDLVIVLSDNVSVHPVVVVTNSDIKLVPNPNKGIFTIKGTLGTTDDQEVSIEITNMIGQVVYTANVMTHNGTVNETVKLNSNLANGMYMLNFRAGAENKVFHVVVEQ